MKAQEKIKIDIIGIGENEDTISTGNINEFQFPTMKQIPINIATLSNAYNAYYRDISSPLRIKLVDDVDNPIAKIIGSQIQKQMNLYQQTSFEALQRLPPIKFQVVLEFAKEKIIYNDCFLTSVSYCDMDFLII